MDRVRFISIEDEHPDLILSFALDDEETGVKSLILLRSTPYEKLLAEEERGVHVAMEGEEEPEFDLLESISIEGDLLEVKTQNTEYKVDISSIEKQDILQMQEMLNRMNFDSKFTMYAA
jgi:hypothetical protein